MRSERFSALASSFLLASGIFFACSRPAAFDPTADPMVGKPFVYAVERDTGVLTAPIYDSRVLRGNGWRYEITLKK